MSSERTRAPTALKIALRSRRNDGHGRFPAADRRVPSEMMLTSISGTSFIRIGV
jgi:hypothetical protein